MPGPILCATDLTDHGLAPVELATKLAEAMGAKLALLHVGDPIEVTTTDPVPEEVRPAAERYRAILAERREAQRAALERQCAQVREAGIRCEGTLRDGRPWETIVEAVADAPGTEMVVIGPHAGDAEPLLSRLGTRLLGGTADRVVRHAHLPVVVAASGAGPTLGPGPIVVGVDVTAGARRAATAAGELAARLGRPVVLVHVIPRSTDEEGDPHQDYAAVLYAHAEREARARLEELERDVPGQVEVMLRPVTGTPAEGLVTAADELGASFVVVGTHARQGAARLFLGSTAEQVLRTANVPVMVVPPGAHL